MCQEAFLFIPTPDLFTWEGNYAISLAGRKSFVSQLFDEIRTVLRARVPLTMKYSRPPFSENVIHLYFAEVYIA